MQDDGIGNCKFHILKQLEYLFSLISVRTSNYRTRNTDDVPYFNIRHNFFKNSCFSSSVIEWNKLDSRVWKVKSFTDFKKNILSFIRPKANSVFNCNSPKELKFVTRLRLGLSHLDSINSLCSCSLDNESTIHFTISFTALNSQSKNPLSWTQSLKLTINCCITTSSFRRSF